MNITTPPVQNQPAPAEPVAVNPRAAELRGDVGNTVFEFQGDPQADRRGAPGTFIGGVGSMPDFDHGDENTRQSNLKGGGPSWLLALVGAAVVGGGFFAATALGGGDEDPQEDAAKTDAKADAKADPKADAKADPKADDKAAPADA
ncbi:MAG: hypothetical protein ACPG77_17405, partial [Nannocystaceae bacterium]